LQERKKIEELLIAFSKIKDRVSNEVGVTIVGSGEIKEKLERVVKIENIVDRVTFLEQTVDEIELKQLFSKSLAYVSPGHVGLGVLHAFAYGAPVVTQRHNQHAPEVANIKNNMNGILYEGGTKELAEIMLRLANENGFAMKLGNNAYEYYQKERTMEALVGRVKGAIEYVRQKNQTQKIVQENAWS
jgi:glycosyltransferase involved in cell wall biosynthesis